jgi:hypothetical protein
MMFPVLASFSTRVGCLIISIAAVDDTGGWALDAYPLVEAAAEVPPHLPFMDAFGIGRRHAAPPEALIALAPKMPVSVAVLCRVRAAGPQRVGVDSQVVPAPTLALRAH